MLASELEVKTIPVSNTFSPDQINSKLVDLVQLRAEPERTVEYAQLKEHIASSLLGIASLKLGTRVDSLYVPLDAKGNITQDESNLFLTISRNEKGKTRTSWLTRDEVDKLNSILSSYKDFSRI